MITTNTMIISLVCALVVTAVSLKPLKKVMGIDFADMTEAQIAPAALLVSFSLAIENVLLLMAFLHFPLAAETVYAWAVHGIG